MKKILIGDELLIMFAIIGETTFGVNIKHINSVIEPSQTRVVPLAPTHINTILNSHGKIITVLDIYKYLGYKTKIKNPEPKVIYLRIPGQHVGLLVDKVKVIDYVTPSCIEPCPDHGPGKSETDFCKNIFVLEEGADGIYWIDPDKLEEFISEMELS